ncbi:MAG: TIGR04211 family SH3 domain-containing protein [Woeseiaceae bacterium]
MIVRNLLRPPVVLLCFSLAAFAARAEPAWVSDEFEIMLRTGPTTRNAIQLMLGSGTRLEVLANDPETGYSRVRTAGGTEGWVLTRYLMGEPAAREQLQQLTSELTSASERGSSLGSQLNSVKSEYDNATRRIATLEREKETLQNQLDEIRRTAANVLAIDEQNKNQRQQLADAEIRVSTLEQENETLTRQTNRNWFLSGAGVLFGGLLIGLLLPKLRLQRRSRYERF